MKIIVGLGNPTRRYRKTRHNVGFEAVEFLARTYHLSFSLKRFNASLAVGKVEKTDVVLAKPLTFMNLSGQSVAPLLGWYDIMSHDLLVVFDDINLPTGQIRIRRRGSSGGHKGVQSIIDRLGTEDFPRVRIGIRGENLPPDLAEYVLEEFAPEELPVVHEAIERTCEAIGVILSENIDLAMTQFNRRVDAGEHCDEAEEMGRMDNV